MKDITRSNNSNWRGGADKECIICNKLFWVKPSHKMKRICCSRKCAAHLAKISGRLKGKNNPAYGSPKIKLICQNCNKIYEILKRKSKNRKFCSKQCTCLYIGKRDKSGTRNPNYNNGHKITGNKNPNWKNGRTFTVKLIRKTKAYRDLKNQVKIRDNFQCIWCKSQDQLEVDHIKPICTHLELALEINNCRTLCKPCHKKTDTYAGKATRGKK